MRILLVHNRYQQRGGEDAVFEAEAELLEHAGHDVSRCEFSNDEIPLRRSPLASAQLAMNTLHSRAAIRQIQEIIERQSPDVAHFHNTFPLVSPGSYAAGAANGAAVVQTLHNYRMLCPSATFHRDGHICEDCLGRTPPWPGVWHGCYRDSRRQTAVVAAMLTAHRLRHTWNHSVDRYVALTEFVRQKFIEGGLPACRIAVKPNFAAIDDASEGDDRTSFLFVGRLVPEKGIATLLATWSDDLHAQLILVGDGPLRSMIETASGSGVRALGSVTRTEVIERMRTARALIFPSEWYETFGLGIIEAFACRTPVIASRLGAMAEIVDDGVTGLLFEPGNADDLARKVRWAAAHPAEMREMGTNARREYEAKYTPERNYSMLMEIYEQAIEHALQRRGA